MILLCDSPSHLDKSQSSSKHRRKKTSREKNFQAFRLDKRETPKSIEIANLNFPVVVSRLGRCRVGTKTTRPYKVLRPFPHGVGERHVGRGLRLVGNYCFCYVSVFQSVLRPGHGFWSFARANQHWQQKQLPMRIWNANFACSTELVTIVRAY